MQRTQATAPDVARIGRAVGDLVTIGINLVLLYVVRHVMDWGWPAFLTEDFDAVVPWISASLIATVVASIVYLADDRRVIRRMGGAIVGVVSLLATIRVFQVMPFDFSEFDFDWSIVATAVLVLAIVGTAIGIVTDLVGLLTGDTNGEKGQQHADVD